jgi:uncharacterized protein (DUF736 family)
MIIGNFTSTGTSYKGTIRTLTLATEAIFEPAEKRSDNSPDFRITNGETEIGVAWKDTSEAGNAYLSVRLEDPALPASIFCALVKTGAEHGHTLIWERKRRRA